MTSQTSQTSQWTRVAVVSDVPTGEAKAVKLAGGRSIALFNVDGRIYATNNQCPHMGYPLTRGTVRHGVVTCDWHGRSFDLEGGGCFMTGCDDLETFPVELRNGEVWIDLEHREYKRRDKHLRLLREGLLRSDEWTIAKPIVLLQDGGVRENDRQTSLTQSIVDRPGPLRDRRAASQRHKIRRSDGSAICWRPDSGGYVRLIG